MTKDQEIKRQVCMFGDKTNTWKKYLYLENDKIIAERFVKVENGIEIPSEEGEPESTIALPLNIENSDSIEITNIETGEKSKLAVTQQHPKTEFVKIYNETNNTGMLIRLEDGFHASSQCFRIENNREILCPMPDQGIPVFVPLPAGVSDFSSHEGELSMYDPTTGIIKGVIQKSKTIKIDNTTELRIKEKGKDTQKEILAKIDCLSNVEKEN